MTEPASPFTYAGLSWRRRPSEAPGSRAGPRSTSSRPANSFAGDEVTILGDVQAEEEQLPGRSDEKGDQTVKVLSGNF